MIAKQTDDAPKIEFPCEGYSIKVVGRKTPEYANWVINSVLQHAPEMAVDKVQVIDSRNGNFQSVRLTICAQSEAHLKAIHDDLIASGKVQMVI